VNPQTTRYLATVHIHRGEYFKFLVFYFVHNTLWLIRSKDSENMKSLWWNWCHEMYLKSRATS